MRPVTVYTSETCTLCHSVENLFNVREIPYEKVLLLEDSPQHEELTQRSGMKTLPQVFIGSLLARRLPGDARGRPGGNARRSAHRLTPERHYPF